MSKLFILLPLLCLFGFNRIHDTHDTAKKIDDDFRNVEILSQPKQWKVFTTTPSLNDLEDNECVKVAVSSTNFVSLMCRDNIDIYAVRMSCVTVIR